VEFILGKATLKNWEM